MDEFVGTHEPLLDDKGRLILPARFRPRLEEGIVLTKGQERCVVVWPASVFGSYAATLREQSLTSERHRAFARVFFSSAFDQVPDKQGRISLPGPLRDYAGLARELTVIGQDTRIEIWDRTAWATWLRDAETRYSAVDDGPPVL
jgi:MraZ protein